MIKTALLLLIGAAALTAGNPAVGVEWRWEPLTVTVSPNVKALPFKKVIESYVPKKSLIPGTHVVENCGKSNVDMDRIVGGSVAAAHAYPFQVALFIDTRWFCGGSIISDEWIMTAAHCTHNKISVEVVAGAHNIRLPEPSQVTMVSTDLHVHEQYDPTYFQNDIALIRLPRRLTFTNEISAVCLPTYSDPDLRVGTWVTLTGWGLTSDSAITTASELHVVQRPTLANSECELVYGAYVVTEKVVCIDASNGAGTCSGDSGGPMTVLNDAGATVTRGITSFGSSAGCEKGYPDAFSRVSHLLAWIEATSGIAIGA